MVLLLLLSSLSSLSLPRKDSEPPPLAFRAREGGGGGHSCIEAKPRSSTHLCSEGGCHCCCLEHVNVDVDIDQQGYLISHLTR